MTPDASLPPIRDEFLGASLGDFRRNMRLLHIAEALDAAPERSLPEAMRSEAGLEAAYRFMNNGDVPWFKVLDPHIDRTWKRVEDAGRVLCVHDTTEFAFKGDASRTGLSRLGKGKHGFFGHIALAVSADGERRPLGVLGMLPFVREETVVDLDELEEGYTYEVESDRWATLVELIEDEPHSQQLVHVMDREGDQYPLFAYLNELGSDFVIRLAQNRRTTDAKRYVADVVESAPIMLERTVKLSRRGGDRPPKRKRTHPDRDERVALLEARATAIEIRRPDAAGDHLPEALVVHVVHVVEPNPPDNAEPMKWTLVTSLPVDTPEQVAEVIDIYRARWLIEELFKAVKTGCAYTSRQLASLEALLVMLAVTLPIAWRLLALRWASRHQPDAPASTLFSKLELAVLRRADPKKRGLPPKPTVRHALLAVARLGGHKRTNGEPGWQILGRGLRRLLDQVEGARAMLGIVKQNSGFNEVDAEM